MRDRESGQQRLFNQLLATDIQFQFDVVLGLPVDFFDGGLVAAHQASGLARGPHGAGEGFWHFVHFEWVRRSAALAFLLRIFHVSLNCLRTQARFPHVLSLYPLRLLSLLVGCPHHGQI